MRDTEDDIEGIAYWKMATVISVGGEGALRQHFLDMGIIPGAAVTMVKYAPWETRWK